MMLSTVLFSQNPSQNSKLSLRHSGSGLHSLGCGLLGGGLGRLVLLGRERPRAFAAVGSGPSTSCCLMSCSMRARAQSLTKHTNKLQSSKPSTCQAKGTRASSLDIVITHGHIETRLGPLVATLGDNIICIISQNNRVSLARVNPPPNYRRTHEPPAPSPAFCLLLLKEAKFGHTDM